MEKLTGAGVYYGASMVQAISCQSEDVYMIGGGNSAGQSAIFFSKYARKVTLLVRGNSISKGMSKYLINQINETKNIEVWINCEITEVKGENRLEEIVVNDIKTGEKRTLPTSSLFVFIGAQPHTNWLAGVVERDKNGFILTGPDLIRFGDHKNSHPRGWTLERDPFLLETNIPGVFAAGDVRLGSIKRVASGVGEGSIAIQFVHQYLNRG